MPRTAATHEPRLSRPRATRRPSRLRLTHLIEQKVQTLSDPDLRRLAAELKITQPDGSMIRSVSSRPKLPTSGPGAGATDPDGGSALHLAGRGVGPLVSRREGRANLDFLTRDDPSTDWAASDLLGAGELAARLDVARATLDNWRHAGKIVAFRKGIRNFVYPLRQFERFGPLEGVDHVLAHFPTPEDAWEWLVTPNRSSAGEPPLERLRAKHVDEVVRAAEGALDYA